jgi:hypothetical protein
MTTPVTVNHPVLGRKTGRTVDISDGGVGVALPGCGYAVGDTVSVQASTMDDAPIIEGVVVRVTEEGIGIRFSEQNQAE